MALRKLESRYYGGKWPVSIKYENLHSFKEVLIVLCQEYPWNEKINTFTWLISLYNPFNSFFIHVPNHALKYLNMLNIK